METENGGRSVDKIERQLLHRDLTEQIIGAAMEVHNTLGSGFLEKVYENALVVELRLRGLAVEQQDSTDVRYKGRVVGQYVADILVEGLVVLELKALDKLTGDHEAQVLNYLKATGLKVGLLINFGRPRLEWERLVL